MEPMLLFKGLPGLSREATPCVLDKILMTSVAVCLEEQETVEMQVGVRLILGDGGSILFIGPNSYRRTTT